MHITKRVLCVMILRFVALGFLEMLFLLKIIFFYFSFQQHLEPLDPPSSVFLVNFSDETTFTRFKPSDVCHRWSEETTTQQPLQDSSPPAGPCQSLIFASFPMHLRTFRPLCFFFSYVLNCYSFFYFYTSFLLTVCTTWMLDKRDVGRIRWRRKNYTWNIVQCPLTYH